MAVWDSLAYPATPDDVLDVFESAGVLGDVDVWAMKTEIRARRIEALAVDRGDSLLLLLGRYPADVDAEEVDELDVHASSGGVSSLKEWYAEASWSGEDAAGIRANKFDVGRAEDVGRTWAVLKREGEYSAAEWSDIQASGPGFDADDILDEARGMRFGGGVDASDLRESFEFGEFEYGDDLNGGSGVGIDADAVTESLKQVSASVAAMQSAYADAVRSSKFQDAMDAIAYAVAAEVRVAAEEVSPPVARTGRESRASDDGDSGSRGGR